VLLRDTIQPTRAGAKIKNRGVWGMDTIGEYANRLWVVFLSLPPITQTAVTVLLVCGIIAHVAYNERTVHDGPSIFTTGGIFFTFLGIAQGLYGFDPSKIDASIPLLLDGLKTAFIASVVGVGAALSIKLRYALLGLPALKHDTKTEGATVDDLYGQLIAVQQSIAGQEDSTLLTQLKLTRTDTNDRLDRLQRSYDEFARKAAENNSKALIQALQEVIRDFNTKISEQFGENFKKLNEAVGQLLMWQDNYRVQVSEMIRQQSETANNMSTAADRYTALVGKAEIFSSVASQLSQILTGLENQRSQLQDSLKALAQLLTSASTSLPQIESKIVQLTEQVTFGVRQNQDQMTQVIRNAGVSLQAAMEDAKKVLFENMQVANQQVNEHMQRLADKTTEQLVKLDTALETELSKSISSLGRQLTALSSRFVEDYTMRCFAPRGTSAESGCSFVTGRPSFFGSYILSNDADAITRRTSTLKLMPAAINGSRTTRQQACGFVVTYRRNVA
jgi:hypothetical protein